MLVTTKEMLLDAQANHYAVGAFNIESLEFVMAVLAAAEETKSPVIMQPLHAGPAYRLHLRHDRRLPRVLRG